MSASDRFEIRCTPEIRELVEVLRGIEGDTTFSQLFRRLAVAHARDLVKQIDGDAKARIRRVLAKIAEVS